MVLSIRSLRADMARTQTEIEGTIDGLCDLHLGWKEGKVATDQFLSLTLTLAQAVVMMQTLSRQIDAAIVSQLPTAEIAANWIAWDDCKRCR